MNMALCLCSILILSIAYGVINVLSIKKQQLMSVYNQNLSFAHAIFALIALEIGGSMMLSNCQESYSAGLYGMLYVIGISIGFLVLGFGFAHKMKSLHVESTLDVFEIKYHSPLIRTSASILSLLTTWGLLIGQIIAAKSLLQALGIHSDTMFIILAVCVILYTVLGGLSAAGITYSIQMIYTIIVFGGIFAYCLAKEPPSFIFNLISSNTLFPENTISFSYVFGYLVMPALYYLTDQEYARPLFEVTNKKTAAAAAIGASLFMLLFSLVPIYFGIKAKALNLIIGDEISPLIPVLKVLTNDIVVVLAVCGMAAALIAMIDYYLWSVSLTITHELNLACKKIPNTTTSNKYMVIAVGILALAATYCTSSSAMQVLMYSYELYDSCLIVPLLMSCFAQEVKKGSAIGAILFGLTSFFIFPLLQSSIPTQIVSLGLSLIGFYIGEWIELVYTKFILIKRSKTLGYN